MSQFVARIRPTGSVVLPSFRLPNRLRVEMLPFIGGSQFSHMSFQFPRRIKSPYGTRTGYICRTNAYGHRQYSSSRFNVSKPDGIVGSVIAVCVGIFCLHWVCRDQARNSSREARRVLDKFGRHMVMSTRNIREGRYYTYLTSTFTHFNTAHLLFNMMALWSFGRPIVAIWGASQFAILWIGSGLVGGFAQSSLWHKQSLGDERAIGASGSLFGLTTALACLAPQMRVVVLIFPMQLGLAMFSGAAFSVAAIQQNWLPWVGHADHLGGIAFGVIWYLVVLRRGRTGHVRSKIF